MRYGFVLPSGDAALAADLAVEAERAGWDGFFAWEGIWAVDAWGALTAAAMRTERIRLGTVLTPLARRLPWEVASQAATLDNLSGGRVILSVGLGAPDARWWIFEDDPGRRIRAERLDEALDMVTGLWSGEPFTYEGRHFRAKPTEYMVPPPPVQRPRIPIWVVGMWPAPKSMRRAARWDGWLPYLRDTGPDHPSDKEQLADGLEWIRRERDTDFGPFDVIVEGATEPGNTDEVRAWADAGATWWLEEDWTVDAKDVATTCRERLLAGPPRV